MLVRYKLEVDREDHEEPLAQRSGNFSVVELAYPEEVFLGEVEANFLPSLAHGCRSNYPLVNRTSWGVCERTRTGIQASLITLFHSPAENATCCSDERRLRLRSIVSEPSGDPHPFCARPRRRKGV